jgi:multidrug resistance efflux pump
MKRLQGILGWIAPLVILGAAIAVFLLMGSQPPPQRVDADAPAAVPVRTAVVAAHEGGIDIESDGVVVPLREVTLAAEVSGRVLEKSSACRSGQYVTKGTVLFRIDPRDYELDVARLERELQQAVLTIDEIDEELTQNAESIELSKRQLEIAKREANRLDTLAQGRIVTESAADQAARDELTTTNTLSNLQGQRRVLQKRRNRLEEAQQLASTMLERARLDLERTTIRAPVDGVVVDDLVEQESYVSKGTTLVMLEDTSAAEVKTSLRMDEVARIWGAQSAVVAATPGAYEIPETSASVVYTLGDRSYSWSGQLARQEGRGLDEKTRTLPCRVLVPDPTGVRAVDAYGAFMPQLPPEAPRSLLRGMFVQVRVHVDTLQKLVSIPEDGLRPTGEVWVVRDGHLVILRPRPVEVSSGRVYYDSEASGLAAGDRVVTSQLANPRDRMAVSDADGVSVAGPSEDPT